MLLSLLLAHAPRLAAACHESSHTLPSPPQGPHVPTQAPWPWPTQTSCHPPAFLTCSHSCIGKRPTEAILQIIPQKSLHRLITPLMTHLTEGQQMTEHNCLLVLMYKKNWSRRQFKLRFPNTGSCQHSTRWFLKVDLIRADNLLRIQSTFLKWHKINRGKTFTLIWNWTHRLYESWHLHMRKLHMGDQSFSLTGSTSTHIDLGILCLPTDTHTSYILGRLLLKGHPENMFRRLQAHISSHCMTWEPGFGKGSLTLAS